jgi:phospholipase C
MDSRRGFIKKAAMLSGGLGFFSLPASIQKAFAINPSDGSTYLDAEHIVFLMQENRSFDHTYGTLQGVRGFNDPRAIRLPNKNLVWLQRNKDGETYAPFRLDIKDTKITWMGSLPHSWTNQVDARNNGKYDKWLDVKQSGEKDYENMPLTMGYYTREDIPFYYALADAFTVCDQHFCSSLTGTTPNRLYFWTGTIREEQHENSKANVWNEDADYNTNVKWKTFPERLEENDISWKIYQNDISVNGGFTDEEDAWMANFGDNPIEYFSQYNVKLSERYINYMHKQLVRLPGEIKELDDKVHASSSKDKKSHDVKKKLEAKKAELIKIKEEITIYTREKYDQLSQHEKNLHEKAFCDNKKDPAFYHLTSLQYKDGNTERELNIPKGDILHQFRQDVTTGNLPTVSWIVAPENFSDHPSSAWFGAWYVSEVMDILTQNPEVWKKTIFILTYDENDGYFDHVPPFVVPNPHDETTGKTSEGLDTSVDYVTMEQERKKKIEEKYMRQSPIGLGYRVPLVIASPWSRGGFVCSEVFDHTSSLQFLENFLSEKKKKKILESNISPWRRSVCGDLTSVFRPYNGEKINMPFVVEKDSFIESIHKAKFKKEPSAYKKLTTKDIEHINRDPHTSLLLPKQEKGVRASCPIPYELYVDGKVNSDKKSFEVVFEARNEIFGSTAAGSPFIVYAPGKYLQETLREWTYAAAPGTSIKDLWQMDHFENNLYHLLVYGPNGFFREFKGNGDDPLINILFGYEYNSAGSKKLTGNLEIKLTNLNPGNKYTVEFIDNVYKTPASTTLLDTANSKNADGDIILNLGKSFNWYDITVKIKGNDFFERRYAGHVETGEESKSDPAMGMVI